MTAATIVANPFGMNNETKTISVTSGLSAIRHPHLRVAVGLSILGALIFALVLPRLLLPTQAALGPAQQDYIAFYAAARAAWAETMPGLYVQSTFQDWIGFPASLHWMYPPTFLAVLAPIAGLAYPIAKVVLAWIGVICTYLTARRAGGTSALGVLAVLSPVSFVSLWIGQISAIFGFLLVTGLFCSARRPVWAGLCFGLLTIKPHYGLLVLPFLILTRAWTVIGVAVAVTFAMVGVSLAIFGLDPWSDFISSALLGANADYLLLGGHPGRITLFEAQFSIGLGSGYRLVPYVVLIAVAVAGQIVLARHASQTHLIAFTLAAAAMVAPYFYTYDFFIVAAAILVTGVHARIGLGTAWMFILLWCAPVFTFFGIALDLLPALLWSCLVLGAWLIYRAKFDSPEAPV